MKEVKITVDVLTNGEVTIDVDGVEHLILSGAERTLRNTKCKTVFVEVNDSFEEQAQGVYRILVECGFYRRDRVDSGRQSCNQIWIK